MQQAQWMSDKAQAHVELHSAEALLLFELLTTKKVNKNTQNNNGAVQDEETASISQRWNFFAQPFIIANNVTVKIQDEAGHINLHYPQTDRLKALLKGHGLSEARADMVTDSLLDWQDIDSIQRHNGAEQSSYGNDVAIRNGAIPSIDDIAYVKNMSTDIVELLKQTSTIYKKGAFSPMNAPQVLLQALTNKSIAEKVVSLRNNGQLTQQLFRNITGIKETDNIFFYTSNYLKIELSSKIGDSRVVKSMNIFFQPYAENTQTPINIYVSRG